jgi:large subunit ribosomal protein L29
MKIYEIREMTTDEILKRIVDEEKNLVDMRFQHELKQLTNTGKLKEVKRDIAKMKTVLKERELEEQKTAKENK